MLVKAAVVCKYHGWVDVPGIDCTSMLIVRTWFPNSFLRVLVCCLIWLQMFLCLGTQGGKWEEVVLARWHFSDLQHRVPDGDKYPEQDFFRDTKESTTLVLLQSPLSTHPCSPKLQKFCVSAALEPKWNWAQEIQKFSVSLQKLSPGCLCRMFLGVLEQIESTPRRAGRGWCCWITCQEWSGSEMKGGKAAKGGCETFEGGKNLKIQSFRGAVSAMREWCSAPVGLHHEAQVSFWPFYLHPCSKLHPQPLCNAYIAVKNHFCSLLKIL